MSDDETKAFGKKPSQDTERARNNKIIKRDDHGGRTLDDVGLPPFSVSETHPAPKPGSNRGGGQDGGKGGQQ